MRLSNVILVLSLGGIGAAGSLMGCSDEGTTGATGGSASTSTGSTPADPCSPGASCVGSKSECLGLVDYAGKTQFTPAWPT